MSLTYIIKEMDPSVTPNWINFYSVVEKQLCASSQRDTIDVNTKPLHQTVKPKLANKNSKIHLIKCLWNSKTHQQIVTSFAAIMNNEV